MNFVRRHHLALVLLACAAAVGTEAWWWRGARAEARQARLALEQKKQERDWLERQTPAPTEAAERALAQEREDLLGQRAELRRALAPRPPGDLAGPAPAGSTDAYFELAGLVETARAQAIRLRVNLQPEERFGFSRYAHEGPAADQVGTVHRQQAAVRELLGPLFEARPLALLGVQRRSPEPRTAEAPAVGDDIFALVPGLSLERTGLVTTEAVRVEFTGQTSTLRTFMQGLARMRHPVVVRDVEVEPLPWQGRTREASAADAAVPVVRQSISKFAVTVEFVLLEPETAPRSS